MLKTQILRAPSPERGIWIDKEPDDDRGISRRTLLKVGVAAGAAGLAGISGYAVVRTLTGPPTPPTPSEVRDTFIYLRPPGTEVPVWYEEEGLVGEEARLSHFQPGRGANSMWRVAIDGAGRVVPGTGLPALLIQTEEEVLEFPEGYPRDEFVINGLYAVFNCCTHACCRTGWQILPRSQYVVDTGKENVYCTCHHSQYDPRIITEYRHPAPPEASGATYIGIHMEPGTGPANRGMPLIPLELEGDKILGRMKDESWYLYLSFKGGV